MGKLIHLAILTIGYGAAENPNGIGDGVDVLTLNHQGRFFFKTVEQSQVEEIRERFDAEMLQLFEKVSEL
jgi:hypothetical protein